MLITDDCSTDNSVEIIETFVEKDNRIKLNQIKILVVRVQEI